MYHRHYLFYSANIKLFIAIISTHVRTVCQDYTIHTSMNKDRYLCSVAHVGVQYTCGEEIISSTLDDSQLSELEPH